MTARRVVLNDPPASARPSRVAAVRSRRHDQHILPEVALRLARVLRSGVPLEPAIQQVDHDIDHAHRNLATAAQHVFVGRNLGDVIRDWTQHATSDAEHLLVGVLDLGVRAGADLAVALDAVGEAIRDEVDHERRRRILLTQNQMSAAVLVCLPLLFAAIASLTRGFVYSGRLGLAFLVGGLVLDALGVLWIRRLLRRLR